MAIQTAEKISLSRVTILEENGMVILPLAEYEKLRQNAVTTYYLEGKEAEELDNLVREGRKEYEAGKCKTIKSLADLD